eukprot:TRINITY_DN6128_c0_g1_i1.p1 TRINITY_DN6128_c0_g1~~TRINITY_DN6128_c0_g1_i1.p1  ORF type:complete len:548 (-),score=103.50 TRINITY_DN6128_c0_g1_i1:1362-2897(-)
MDSTMGMEEKVASGPSVGKDSRDGGGADGHASDSAPGATGSDGKAKQSMLAHQFKPRGRAGVSSLKVKFDSDRCGFTDLYTTFLKLPASSFIAVVFFGPLVLSLIFTLIYLLDLSGLQLEVDICAEGNGWLAKSSCGAVLVLHVFLYALSLSTTFAGSPMAAASPFTLIVANLNTLMAQFLFVFLSGAVFARMSQPAQVIRCSKQAVIRKDDVVLENAGRAAKTAPSGEGHRKRYKVFAMRLVLIGPHPCEVVDVKICLTFRILLKLANGSIFVSTHDLPLVRPEVSYLRYGLMCRHIIDEDSPIYHHSKESMAAGDASFSLTIVGMERTSMQSIFHMQEYYVHDGDVVWDGDFHDFVTVDEHGHRVLDHTRLDMIKHFKSSAYVSTAISRMTHDMHRKKELAQHSGLSEEKGEGTSGNSKEAGGSEGSQSGTSGMPGVIPTGKPPPEATTPMPKPSLRSPTGSGLGIGAMKRSVSLSLKNAGLISGNSKAVGMCDGIAHPHPAEESKKSN